MNRYIKSTAFFLALFCLLALLAGCVKPAPEGSDAPSASSPVSLDGKESTVESNGEARPSLPSASPSLSQPSPTPSLDDASPSLPSKEPDVLTFYLENAAGAASREISLPLTIENNDGIAGYSVTVCYDPQVLTFLSCKNNVPGGFSVTNSTVTGKVRVMCTVMGGNKLTLNGVCDLLTFRINEGVNVGSYPLELILADASDSVYIVTDDGKTPSVDCTLKGSTLNVHC